MNRRTALIIALLALNVLLAHARCSLGHAQIDAAAASGRRDTSDLARLAAHTEPAVLLARMAWLEAGAHVQPGEVAAMHEVITTRQRGSYQRTAYQYSAGLRNPRRASTHRLTRRPLGAGWPRMHREHWPRVLAAADAVIAGELHHGCTGGRLEHWGGPRVDSERIARLVRLGYAEAQCPGYANTYLTRGSP